MLEENKEYFEFVEKIKERISSTQYKAISHINAELIKLYWNIGKDINEKSEYGMNFIESLAKDIKESFPNIKGFSVRNLRYMKNFATEIIDEEYLSNISTKLTWSHNIILVEKLNSPKERLWYGHEAIENAWSVKVLEHQIATNLIERQDTNLKIQNFNVHLPPPQSELAIQTMKDPYIFDFVEFEDGMKERELENKLIDNIKNFLLEMGSGFAFLGNQYPLSLDDEEFFLDILFYNIKLRSYVIIDLKTGKLTPEYAGKMNFYLSIVEEQLKTEQDNPSIGLILCRDKNKVVAEYALKDMSKPIGVSEYKFMQELPSELQDTFPDIKKIEKEINKKDKG